MRILITGASGYVGTALNKFLTALNHEIITVPSRATGNGCELSDLNAVQKLAENIDVDAVVHCAGNKNVGQCEEDPSLANADNCLSTKNIAQVFGQNARIVYISTDYVFDGSRGGYSEKDTPAPSTVYGQSKLDGEKAGQQIAPDNFFVLRTGAVYGKGASFVKFLNEKLSAGESVDCFENIIYSPVWEDDLGGLVDALLLSNNPPKISHAAGSLVSRYEFAKTFAQACGFDESFIIKSSATGDMPFLFTNLSLDGCETLRALKYDLHSHIDALKIVRESL